jgi:hypothetical protein
MEDTKSVLRKLEEVRAETLLLLEDLTQAQLDARPPQCKDEEAWSLGEVFMHLAIDEVYLRELIARPLLDGIKPPVDVSFLPPPPPYGIPKDVIFFWFDRSRKETRRLLDNLPEDANLDITHEGGFEAMNGLKWLEAYAGHEAFHHQQIKYLIVQLPEFLKE